MRHNTKTGFTLIELIIVIVIIGILASITVPMMQSMKVKAICAEAVTGMGAIRMAMLSYAIQCGHDPTLYGNSLVADYNYDPTFFRDTYVGFNSPKDISGTYIGAECYEVLIWPGAWEIHCNPVSPNPSPSSAPRAAEVDIIKDPGYASWYLVMGKNGKIRQYGISKSGYPQ